MAMETAVSLDDTMVRAVDRIYARALLELAQEGGELEDVAEQMSDLSALVGAQPQFGQLLRSPSVSDADKAVMLEHAFKDRVHPLIYRFILVLQRKGRARNLPGIVVAFRQLYNEKHGVMEVRCEVAQPLDDASKQAIAGLISKINQREVALHETIDPDLIGGFKLRAGDRLFDASIAAQLRRLRRHLSAAGEATARGLVNQIVIES